MTGAGSRKRTSQACQPCGKRKTRCDGATPICRQCQANGRECYYGVSKRNKIQKCNVVYQAVADSPLREPETALDTDLRRSPAQLLSQQSHDNDFVATPAFHPDVNDASDASPWALGAPTFLPTQGPSAVPSGDGVVVDRDVSNRLLHAYFSFIHPVWPIIYKPLYDSAGSESLSTLLPQPVLYAIYSIAACLTLDSDGSQTSSGLKVPPPTLFFEAALLSIQRNGNSGTAIRPMNFHPLHLLRPSVENCQALTLLALQQHGCAEPSNAFMLCSLASAMAIELELHKAKGVDADPTSVQIASRLWWNLFVLDKMIACELGKPVSLRSEDSNATFPAIAESDEYQLLQFQLHDVGSTTTTKSYTLSGFHATIRITKIMEKVARQIYSLESRKTIRENLQAAEQLRMKLWQELKDYYASLAVSSSSGIEMDVLGRKAIPPSLVTNAVWTWTTIILVHRPFYLYWQEQEWLPCQPLLAAESHPLDVSFAAAENICQILEIHVENLQRFPCDLIYPIFTTASTLSHYRQLHQGTSHARTITRRLAMCIKWLSILGSNWKHAGKSKERLTKDLGIPSRRDLEPNPVTSNPRPVTRGTALSSTLTQDAQGTSPGSSGNRVAGVEGLQSSDSGLRNEGPSANIDWAFLNMLGDTNDELYAMNNDFREILGNGLELTFEELAGD